MPTSHGIGPAAALVGAGLFLAAPASGQATIDNDIPAGEFGSLSIDLDGAATSRDGNITGRNAVTGELVESEFIFDYFHYVQLDGGVLDLADFVTGGPTLTGDDQVTSSGSFAGSNGTTVNWQAVSSIPDGGSTLTTTLRFDGNGTPLGNLRLIDYIDQDVLDVSDDVLFTTGSAAGNNLQVFTVDDAAVVGVSQSGAFNEAQGLQNAVFAGWAADEFSDLRDDIEDGLAAFSPEGVIDLDSLPEISRPALGGGVAYGPDDVTTALAWDVDPSATTATVVFSLGGIPDAAAIPEPASAALLLGLAGGGLLRRRR